MPKWSTALRTVKNFSTMAKNHKEWMRKPRTSVRFRDRFNGDLDELYLVEFATLYSVDHRIPLYSAYILDDQCLEEKKKKGFKWQIEPQVRK